MGQDWIKNVGQDFRSDVLLSDFIYPQNVCGYLLCGSGTLRNTGISYRAQMSVLSSSLHPSLEDVTLSHSTGRNSWAVTGSELSVQMCGQCKVGSPGEAGCRLSQKNGSSLSK